MRRLGRDEDQLIKTQNNQQQSNKVQRLVRLCTVEIQRQLKHTKESNWSREPINLFEEFLPLHILLTVKNAQSKLYKINIPKTI